MTPSMWFGVLILALIAEVATVGLVTIWFVLGALGAMLVSMAGASLWVQITVFLVLSILSVLLLRPIAEKYLKPKYVPTNADRVVGKTAVVTEEINNLASTGAVSVTGQTWTARSEQDIVIPVKTQVKVLRIEGVKVIVALD